MAEAFARYTNGNAHIIICGHNRAAAQAIIASFPKPTITAGSGPQPAHEFVQCDATLMKNVKTITTELLSCLPKVNFLVMSPGFLMLMGRDETEEGIDKKLALNYYARWKCLYEVAPLLTAAKDKGEDAKVMSILAAGKGGQIDLDDLGLKKNYSVRNAVMASLTYTDLMMEVSHLLITFQCSKQFSVRNFLPSTQTWHLPMSTQAWSGPLCPSLNTGPSNHSTPLYKL
jgi:NAD(P)-dependent dehydrogenase (short-subunit alcohol dehydrogenase family)